jgi:hypothetical protein
LLFVFFQLQRSQAVADFWRHGFDAHAFLHHQLAGKRFSGGAFVSQVESHAAILTFLIPAKAAVGNLFGRQILKAAQYGIVLWNFEFPARDCDSQQTGKWAEGRGWCSHGCRDEGNRRWWDGWGKAAMVDIKLASGGNAGVMMRVMAMLLIVLFIVVMLVRRSRFRLSHV